MSMGEVLGIIGCVVLGDEIAHVLSKDPEIKNIYVVDNEEGRLLMPKLCDKADLKPQLIKQDQVDIVSRSSGLTVLIWMNSAGPHDNQEDLRNAVKAVAVKFKDLVGYSLCFYGLCRNSLWHIDNLSAETGVPLMILTDPEGREVDDCFGANFGGKASYLDAIRKNHGTIFVTPGYAENWNRRQSRKDMAKIMEQVESMRFVFERMEYSQVMRLDNGLGDQQKFEERVDGFSRIFDLNVISRNCTLDVFEHSYQLAKERLRALYPYPVMAIKKTELNGVEGGAAIPANNGKDITP